MINHLVTRRSIERKYRIITISSIIIIWIIYILGAVQYFDCGAERAEGNDFACLGSINLFISAITFTMLVALLGGAFIASRSHKF